jgi:hypothetical protein
MMKQIGLLACCLFGVGLPRAEAQSVNEENADQIGLYYLTERGFEVRIFAFAPIGELWEFRATPEPADVRLEGQPFAARTTARALIADGELVKQILFMRGERRVCTFSEASATRENNQGQTLNVLTCNKP